MSRFSILNKILSVGMAFLLLLQSVSPALVLAQEATTAATPAAQVEEQPQPSPLIPQGIFTARNFLLALLAITVFGGIYLYRKFKQ